MCIITSILQALIFYPIVELVLLLGWGLAIRSPWKQWVGDASELKVEERALSATVILSELNAIITASSVLIAGIATFVALIANSNAFSVVSEVKISIFYAAVWALFGLLMPLYTMATLPTRTPKENFVKSYPVALLAGGALVFPFLAGGRFVATLVILLYF